MSWWTNNPFLNGGYINSVPTDGGSVTVNTEGGGCVQGTYNPSTGEVS